MSLFSIRRGSRHALVLISALALFACDDEGGGELPLTDGGGPERDAQVDPDEGVVDPDEGVVDPDEGVVDPDEGVVDPDEGVVDPDEGVVDPDDGVEDPDEGIVDPDDGVEPDEGVIDPDEGVVECDNDEACVVDNPCTAGACVEGVCEYTPIEECCVEDSECADEDLCTDDLCVDNVCQNVEAEGCCVEDADCGAEGICNPAGRCADHAAVGDVIITEIMFNPSAVGDSDGEWFELHNPTDAAIDLNGWGLQDNRGDVYPIAHDAPVIIEAGAYIVLGKNGDVETNGGVEVAYVYDAALQLGNSGDELHVLDPFGASIDLIIYGDGWQTAPGSSLSLDPESLAEADRNNPAFWCASLAPALPSGDRASPGAPNPSCTPAVKPVDWCRFQWPVDQTSPAGTEFTAYVRMYEAGQTDIDDGVNPSPIITVEVGFGPDGTDPSADEAWVFFEAGPNWDWNAAESGEPNNDEYMGDITAPSAGAYDLAARVTVDGGQSWTYCDINADGSDGSADGYQIENAGQLTVEASACDPNPCLETQMGCRGNTAVTFATPGVCSLVEGGFECEYLDVETETDCGLDTCEDGACVSAGQHPAPGEVIFTEVLYDPNGQLLLEENAEWFEIHNRADGPRTLNGCTVGDSAAPTHTTIENITLEAGAYFIFAHSADPALNGGFEGVATYGFGLNSGGDSLILTCDGVEISMVNFDEGDGFPNARAASIQLDPAAYGAEDYSDPALWCLGTEIYFEGEVEEDIHRGTPGAPNLPCPVADATVDACTLQWPLDLEIGAGEGFAAYGVVLEAGVTDLSGENDVNPSLMGEVGYGPAGSDPAAADSGWTWIPAAPNPERGENLPVDADEYMTDVTAPAPGDYDFAYRFKRGEGEWLYCDRAAEGYGSADGYQVENAGHMTSFASPCEGDPCAEAPAPTCADGTTLVEYVAPGECAAEGDQAICTHDEIHTDCAVNGGTCADGACVGALPHPLPGEIVVTEMLYNPHEALRDGEAEWFELYNNTDHAVTLHGCVMQDSLSSNAEDIVGVIIEPGAYALFGQNADVALNGGLTFDHLYNFGLNNSGDAVEILCDDARIDLAAFQGVAEGERRAYQLDPAQIDADANDVLDNWCYASDVYFSNDDPINDHMGTPGAPNPPCPEVIAVDACKIYAPDTLSGAPGQAMTVTGAIFEAGLTDETPGVDADPNLRFEFGYGPDSSEPAPGWAWHPTVGLDPFPGAAELPGWDGYQAAFQAPAVGLYSYAFRASLDDGQTWIYCDSGLGSEDGYQVALGGQMTVVDSQDPICDPNPCTDPPAPTCDAFGTSVISYGAPGTCDSGTGQAVCAYNDIQIVDCPVLCVDGACVDGGLAPAVGEVIFTEMVYNPAPPLNDDEAEWIELHNLSDARVSLQDCVLSDTLGNSALTFGANHQIEPGAYFIVARSNDAQLNGGLTPDAVFEFALGNTRDSVTLTCGEEIIDTAAYDTGGDTPYANGFSLNLAPAAYNAVDNDVMFNWCRTRPLYSENNHGTPGADNIRCDMPLDWCRLQTPEDGVYADPQLVSYGRLYHEGITDATTGFDADPLTYADFGFGPVGEDPNSFNWIWTRAEPNLEWDGAAWNEPNNDEFMISMPAPEDAGDYNFLYRMTVDDGRTWTYCDRDGTDNGLNAPGILTIEGNGDDPCNPDPCLEADPPLVPPATHCDGDVLTQYFPVRCDGTSGVAECVFDEDRQNCADMNMVCLNNMCTEPPPAAPVEGEVIFTELMANPAAVGDDLGEWIELYNRKASPVLLNGCELDINGAVETLGAITIPAQSHFILIRDLDWNVNGGIGNPDDNWGQAWPMAAFGLAMGNTGRPISLTCDGVLVTSLAYPAAVSGQALQLDWRFYESDAFEHLDNWCLAEAAYGAGDMGSPAQWNVECANVVNPCDGIFCDSPPDSYCIDDQTAFVYEGFGLCQIQGDAGVCQYDSREEPCMVGFACFNGSCRQLEGGFGRVVINEIDYDQPGDEIVEFIELYNEGPDPISLEGWRVDLVNGSNSEIYGTIDLSGLIAPEGYVVIGDEFALPEGVPFFLFDVPNTFHEFQNGDPDGVLLVNAQGEVVDALGYEGAIDGITEGSGGPTDPSDGDNISIGRCPGGIDTGDNGADFREMSATPGAENPSCADPVCLAYCESVVAHCDGNEQQYMDVADCLLSCEGNFAQDGLEGDLVGDTVQCRQTHADLAAEDPEGHCVPAGRDGGGLCTSFGLVPPDDSGVDAQLFFGRRRGPEGGGQLIGLRTRGGVTADNTNVMLGGMPVECVDDAEGLLCTVPAGAWMADLTMDMAGVFVTYFSFYTYEDIDYCNIQWWDDRVDGNDADITGAEGATVGIYGQVYEENVTENDGDPGTLAVEWGYGPLGTDPALIPDQWMFTPASYNGQRSSNDEYAVTATLPGPSGALYSHVFRVRMNGNQIWTYCDLNGTVNNDPNGDNFFNPDDAGLIGID